MNVILLIVSLPLICLMAFAVLWLFDRRWRLPENCKHCGGINGHDLDCDEIRRLKLTGGL